MAQHAFLSASGASRWMNCSPSARLEENFEDSTSSYASEGTLAHDYAEVLLLHHFKQINTKTLEKRVHKIMLDELHSTEMDREVQKFVDYVIMMYQQYATRYNCEPVVMLETKLDFSKYVKEGFGTGDVTIIADSRLAIIDLKYGKGVRVNAHDNPQIRLYGLGAIETLNMFYEVDTIDMVIMQPRLNNISEVTMSKDELIKWAETKVAPAAKLAWLGEGTQKVGDWCKFCKAKPRCKAIAQQANILASKEFADPAMLSDDDILEAMKYTGLMKSWLNSIQEYVIKEAKKGKKWEGYKLVQSTGRRSWIDEDKTKEILSQEGFKKDQYINTKLKGIGDIQKLMSVDDFEEKLSKMLHKPQGKPVLTTLDDPRPDIMQTAETDFNDDFKS
jgi:hypothetical protein